MSDIDQLRVDRSSLTERSVQEASSTDKAYWLSRSPDERLKHVELLRQLNYPGYDPATARIKKVITVTTLEDRELAASCARVTDRHQDLNDLEHLP